MPQPLPTSRYHPDPLATGGVAASDVRCRCCRRPLSDYGSWEPVPPEVVVEVSQRTPGSSDCQQERWWTHCGDAAEFLASAGSEELRNPLQPG